MIKHISGWIPERLNKNKELEKCKCKKIGSVARYEGENGCNPFGVMPRRVWLSYGPPNLKMIVILIMVCKI
jgi:hypothetical protein